MYLPHYKWQDTIWIQYNIIELLTLYIYYKLVVVDPALLLTMSV